MISSRPTRRLAIGLILLSAAFCAEAFDVRVEGLEGEVRDNVEAMLTPVRERSTTTIRQTYRAQTDRAARAGLEALGHYRSDIRYDWTEPKKEGEEPLLTVRITAGPRVKVRKTELTLRGEAADDPAFQELSGGFPPEGTPLNHGDYDAFKGTVERTAIRRGFFDGHFLRAELGIDPLVDASDWIFEYDGGVRYRFGEMTVEGSQIREPILRGILPFKPGDPYSSDDITEWNRRLNATGWFNSVVVSPDIAAGKRSESKTLPVKTRVSPKRGNQVETGLGYSTDVGPRGQLKWTKPWINDSGHSISAATELSTLEQSGDLSYKIPLEENAFEHYWLLQTGYKHEDLNDTLSKGATVRASRYWAPYEGWQKSLSLTWSLNDFTQGLDDYKTTLIYPSATISRTRSRGGLMPRWGESQRVTVDFAQEL